MKNKYKILILITILCINCNTLFSLPPGWEVVYRRPDYSTEEIFSIIMKLVCADSNNCMVYGSLFRGGYYIDRTTDGGKSWSRIHQDTGYSKKTDKNFEVYYGRSVLDMSYPDTNLFIAIVDSGLYSKFSDDGKTRIDSSSPGYILMSKDKGETWQDSSYGTNKHLAGLKMLNKSYGILSISKIPWDTTRYWYYTNDGGLSWFEQNMPKDLLLRLWPYPIDLINRNLFIGIASYRDNLISKYRKLLIHVHNDWETIDTLSCNDSLWFIDFIDENRGWASGGYFDPNDYFKTKQLIKYTSNGGKTWTTQRDTNWRNCVIREVVFFDENFGMAGSAEGLVLRTTNGGRTWNEDIFEQDTNWAFFWRTESVQVPSATTAYLIYDGTYIMKYTWTGIPAAVEEPPKVSGIRISPNPAGEYIEIAFSSPRLKPWVGGSVDAIKIFNLLGECVLSVAQTFPSVDSGQTGMSDLLRIDVSCLPAGVYFVRVGDWVGRFVKI
mgnify:CR=1 FL=1